MGWDHVGVIADSGLLRSHSVSRLGGGSADNWHNFSDCGPWEFRESKVVGFKPIGIHRVGFLFVVFVALASDELCQNHQRRVALGSARYPDSGAFVRACDDISLGYRTTVPPIAYANPTFVAGICRSVADLCNPSASRLRSGGLAWPNATTCP